MSSSHTCRKPAGENLHVVDRTVQERIAELHQIAKSAAPRRSGIDTTSLVSRVYLKLRTSSGASMSGNRLLRTAARAVRQEIIDHVRRERATKRGGGLCRVSLDGVPTRNVDRTVLLDLADALQRLEQKDARKAMIVDLRFFAGLTFDDIARLLGVSGPRIHQEWTVARAWLHERLSS